MTKLLDCTLRDGGYYNNWEFDLDLVNDYLQAMDKLKMDFVEIGFRSLKKNGFKGGFAYSTDEFLNCLKIPKKLNSKIGVMINGSEISDQNTQITNLNRLSNVHIDYLNSGFINFSEKNIVSDHYIQNASFFRLDNLTLGYTINNFIKENPIRLYLTSDNVFVISNYNGIDPEITGGIDSSFYPRARSVAFGFDFKF